LGNQHISAIVDSGTDVCLVNSELVHQKAFQDTAFPTNAETTITVGGQQYHLDTAYRVLIEFPERCTAYYETVFVSPLSMNLDLVMCGGLPYSERITSLITGRHN